MSGTNGFIATLRGAGGQVIQTENRKKALCYKEGIAAYKADIVACPYNDGGFFGRVYSRMWKFGWEYAKEGAGKKR